MFTGLIEHLGQVTGLRRASQAAEVEVDLGGLAGEVRIGDSVAVNGACLTAVAVQPPRARFDVVAETLARTTLGDLAIGDHVNVELPLRVGDRLGGHFVLGHVDGVGTVLDRRRDAGQWTFRFVAPPELEPLLIPKGSIAVDGISLTIADLRGPEFAVAVIPHTMETTTLGVRRPGDRVNLEGDVLGKWIARLLAFHTEKGEGVTPEMLERYGFQ